MFKNLSLTEEKYFILNTIIPVYLNGNQRRAGRFSDTSSVSAGSGLWVLQYYSYYSTKLTTVLLVTLLILISVITVNVVVNNCSHDGLGADSCFFCFFVKNKLPFKVLPSLNTNVFSIGQFQLLTRNRTLTAILIMMPKVFPLYWI